MSFIVIGRNEGWKLTNCLHSIHQTIDRKKLIDAEVIYVDSKSTDDSLFRATEFKGTKIYKLTCDYNAAIARNVGAEKSVGEILFFIDADMELMPEFLTKVLNEKSELIFDFVSGQFCDNYFEKEGDNNLNPYHKFINHRDKRQVVTGGIFIIKRELWFLVNGMRNKYRRSQDLDFGLRLAKKGIRLLRKQEVIAIHNTVDKKDKTKIWEFLFSGADLYGRSMLYRDHITNPNMYIVFLRNDYSLIILFFALIYAIALLSPSSFIFYFLVIVVRSAFSSNGILNKIKRMVYFVIRDLIVLQGFITFFPRHHFSIKYEIVNNGSEN